MAARAQIRLSTALQEANAAQKEKIPEKFVNFVIVFANFRACYYV